MRIQRAILAWSQQDVDCWRQGDVVIPLTAEAYTTALRLPTPATLDPKVFLESPADIRGASCRIVTALHEILKSSPFPWFEAYANVIFQTKVFQLIAWLKLLRSLQTEFRPKALEIYAPQRLGDDSYLGHLARSSFNLASKILKEEGVRFSVRDPSLSRASGSWKVRLLFRRLLKPAVIGAASLGLRSDAAVDTPSSMSPADVVLVSQQHTDSFHAVPLARRLATELGERFLWVGMPPRAETYMTSEEVGLTISANPKPLRFLDSSSGEFRPRHSGVRSIMEDVGSSWQIAGQLAQQTELQLTRARWFEALMDPDLRGFASRYAVWDRVLTKVRPKVLVGLSTLEEMALIRAWARRRNVPFVGFMHGVFPSVDCSYHVDADYLGIFGKIDAEQLTSSGLPQPRRVTACGAMQFGDKLQSLARVQVDVEAQPPRNEVLFLGQCEDLPFCPWTPSDTWRVLREVHAVCCKFGKILRVRPHPRYPSATLAPYVDVLGEERPGTIVLSSEPSLYLDVLRADFAVTSGFDGAVLDALVCGQVVISYIPDRGYQGFDSRVLDKMGATAYDYEQFARLFGELVGSVTRRAELRRVQRSFLDDYILSSELDPWDGAVSLVDEVLQEASRPLPPLVSSAPPGGI